MPKGRFWMGKCESGEMSMNDLSDIRGIVGRFCELRKLSELAQTPYNSFNARKSSRGSSKLQLPNDTTNRLRYCRRLVSIRHSRHAKKSSVNENESKFLLSCFMAFCFIFNCGCT